MSDRIKKKLEDTSEKKYALTNPEFAFLNSMDTVQRTYMYYMDQLKSQYLKAVSLRLGFPPDADLEFSIDLKDETKELSVKVLPKE